MRYVTTRLVSSHFAERRIDRAMEMAAILWIELGFGRRSGNDSLLFKAERIFR